VLRKNAESLAAEFTRLRTENENKGGKIQKVEAEKNTLSYEIKVSNNEISVLEGQLAEFKESTSAFGKDNTDLKAKLTSAIKAYDELSETVKSLRESDESLRKKVETRKTKNEELLARHNALNDKKKEQTKVIDGLNSKIHELSGEIVELKNSENVTQIKLASEQKLSSRLEKEKTEMTSELGKLRSDLEGERSKANKAENQKTDLSYNIKVLKSEKDSLTKTIKDYKESHQKHLEDHKCLKEKCDLECITRQS
jgi:chromosome segregation ATPase